MIHLYSRRRFLHATGFGLALALGALSGCTRLMPGTQAASEYLVYIGTNISSEAENTIFLYRLNPTTGALTPVSGLKGGASPTYLTMDAKRQHLYAVNETNEFQGATSGAVSAFAVDQQTGGLARLSQQPSQGASPCYISLDRTEKAVLVANYMGGNVSVLPVEADGRVGAPTASDQHEGSGPHKNQTAAHAHCFLTDPTNKYAFAVDLGTDKVYGYALNPAQGQLTAQSAPAFTTAPGAGPRHLTFHPNGRYAYLINELNSTVTALAYAAAQGQFRELQTISTLPAGFAENNSCADIHVSPDGKFLYASNRGHNSIAVFRIASDSRLTLVEHESTQGKTPRNFTLDPTGRLLLVGNQNSNNVFTYHVDQKSGQLQPTGQSITIPSPMFLFVTSDFTKSGK
ncbi:lactonase family protein [Hymenobacter sp. BT186]|uniref:Lactonase family protein n=1 Tax=Hymenobacter telluris TaxID=2816474 RepID=A0A939EVK2_9BACT|nr:lactonase family protein [Hymenobacter telluris]MBO0357816.1 lactonase family protein [Hymenobacter telluris]MBW3373843.1 lactonase family protein [Hymenobacter norwichensis]